MEKIKKLKMMTEKSRINLYYEILFILNYLYFFKYPIFCISSENIQFPNYFYKSSTNYLISHFLQLSI